MSHYKSTSLGLIRVSLMSKSQVHVVFLSILPRHNLLYGSRTAAMKVKIEIFTAVLWQPYSKSQYVRGLRLAI